MIPAKAFKNIKSNIICYTYNKSYKKEKWPEYFLRIPNKGDYISSIIINFVCMFIVHI